MYISPIIKKDDEELKAGPHSLHITTPTYLPRTHRQADGVVGTEAATG